MAGRGGGGGGEGGGGDGGGGGRGAARSAGSDDGPLYAGSLGLMHSMRGMGGLAAAGGGGGGQQAARTQQHLLMLSPQSHHAHHQQQQQQQYPAGGGMLARNVSASHQEPASLSDFMTLMGSGPRMEGYLEKLSRSDSRRWKRRWFVFDKDNILYYKSREAAVMHQQQQQRQERQEQEAAMSGARLDDLEETAAAAAAATAGARASSSVAGATPVKVIPLADVDVFRVGGPTHGTNVLEIETMQRIFVLRAETKEEMQSWLFQLSKSVAITLARLMRTSKNDSTHVFANRHRNLRQLMRRRHHRMHRSTQAAHARIAVTPPAGVHGLVGQTVRGSIDTPENASKSSTGGGSAGSPGDVHVDAPSSGPHSDDALAWLDSARLGRRGRAASLDVDTLQGLHEGLAAAGGPHISQALAPDGGPLVAPATTSPERRVLSTSDAPVAPLQFSGAVPPGSQFTGVGFGLDSNKAVGRGEMNKSPFLLVGSAAASPSESASAEGGSAGGGAAVSLLTQQLRRTSTDGSAASSTTAGGGPVAESEAETPTKVGDTSVAPASTTTAATASSTTQSPRAARTTGDANFSPADIPPRPPPQSQTMRSWADDDSSSSEEDDDEDALAASYGRGNDGGDWLDEGGNSDPEDGDGNRDMPYDYYDPDLDDDDDNDHDHDGFDDEHCNDGGMGGDATGANAGVLGASSARDSSEFDASGSFGDFATGGGMFRDSGELVIEDDGFQAHPGVERSHGAGEHDFGSEPHHAHAQRYPYHGGYLPDQTYSPVHSIPRRERRRRASERAAAIAAAAAAGRALTSAATSADDAAASLGSWEGATDAAAAAQALDELQEEEAEAAAVAAAAAASLADLDGSGSAIQHPEEEGPLTSAEVATAAAAHLDTTPTLRPRWSAGACSRTGSRSKNEDRYQLLADWNAVMLRRQSSTGGGGGRGGGDSTSAPDGVAADPRIDTSGPVVNPNLVSLADVPHGFFGVYDGHAGKETVERLCSVLHEHIAAHELFERDLERCIQHVCLSVDELILDELETLDHDNSGSTAIFAILRGNQLTVANVGDCAGVLCRGGVSVPLCRPHKPERGDERRRLENAGAWITEERELFMGRVKQMDLQDPDIRSGAAGRVGVFQSIYRVCGELGVSRAFGDGVYKRFDRRSPFGFFFPEGHPGTFSADLVVTDPDILQLDLAEQDEFMVLACDGLWDVLGFEEAVHHARASFEEGMNVGQVAASLTDRALRMGSADNITVVLVQFGHDVASATDDATATSTAAATTGAGMPTGAIVDESGGLASAAGIG